MYKLFSLDDLGGIMAANTENKQVSELARLRKDKQDVQVIFT